MARKKNKLPVSALQPGSADTHHRPHQRHPNSRGTCENSQSWPRDVKYAGIEPDLEVDCLDSVDDGHCHLVHTFPLYLLSVYFQKAVLFANRHSRPFGVVKRLKLPFRCDIVEELINFAYDGQLNLTGVDRKTFDALVNAADYTVSLRMTAYLETIKKHIFPESFKNAVLELA